jgi:6-phosphogluconate dehydrogenase
MQIGMIGLGRMGANMVRRLIKRGYECVVFDRKAEAVKALVKEGAVGADSFEDFIRKLAEPKTAWLMLPAGEPTETVVLGLSALLPEGSTIVDGGNSFYKDDIRRSEMLKAKGIHYLDVGTSGGVWGLERGYCLMIGGEAAPVKRLEPIFAALAPGVGDIERTPRRARPKTTAEHGYLYCGPSGAGHFVKMVHNGIEYGLMQSYAEGFDIMHNANLPELPANRRYALNLDDVAELWRRGSVVSSWLLDLTAQALAEDPALKNYTGFVHDSGEGRWTIEMALEEAVPAAVLSAALYTRFRSRQGHTFSEKMLSAMRQKFGGHLEPPAEYTPVVQEEEAISG